jgi:predicted TIM-barrel fold metal-dependent hydrolase
MKSAIDFRVRPPLPQFKRSLNQQTALSARAGVELSPSYLQASLGLLFDEMDEAGVERFVVPARSSPMYVVANDFVAELMGQHPDRIIAFGSVDPMGILHDPATEVRRCVQELGLHGIYVEPGLCLQRPDAHDRRITGEAKAGLAMDDIRMFPIYQACSDLGVPVMPDTGPLNGRDLTYTDPIQIDHLTGVFPDLKIICVHACWPYATRMIGVAFKRPNVYLLPDVYLGYPGAEPYTEAIKHPVLQRQVLWGSCYPVHTLKERMEALQNLGVSEDAQRLVAVENPRRLLNLDPVAER